MSRPGGFIRVLREFKRALQRAEAQSFAFGSVGENVSVGAGSEIGPAHNVFVGDDVFIGRDCWLSAPAARISIGSKVMLAPQVAIVTGDHRWDVVGVPMFDVHEKRAEDDQDVTIEDDVWIGFRAVILKGVTVGRGSVIGACSVVTRDIPPYSVVAGVPAKVIRSRFTPQEIADHERLIAARASESEVIQREEL